MSLWNGLHPGLREKAVKSIRHTLKTAILSNTKEDESIPSMEPVPTLELDPDLLAAFLAEPEYDEVDLGPLVAPRTSDRIPVENDIVGESNNDDDYCAPEDGDDGVAEDEDDGVAENEDDGVAEDEEDGVAEDDDDGVEDSDEENAGLSAGEGI
jgi:hypothetical protein